MRGLIVVFLVVASCGNAFGQFRNHGQQVQQQAWMHYQMHLQQVQAQKYRMQVAMQQQAQLQMVRQARQSALQHQRRQNAEIAKGQAEVKRRLAEHQKKMENDPVYAAEMKQRQKDGEKILSVVLAGVGVAILAGFVAADFDAGDFSQAEWNSMVDDAKRHEMERHRRERAGDFSMGIEPSF